MNSSSMNELGEGKILRGKKICGWIFLPTVSVMLGTFGFQTSASEIALWPVSSTTRSELEFFVLRRATIEACDVFVLVLFLLQQ